MFLSKLNARIKEVNKEFVIASFLIDKTRNMRLELIFIPKKQEK
jgi:hypothetical protein